MPVYYFPKAERACQKIQPTKITAQPMLRWPPYGRIKEGKIFHILAKKNFFVDIFDLL